MKSLRLILVETIFAINSIETIVELFHYLYSLQLFLSKEEERGKIVNLFQHNYFPIFFHRI